MTSGKREETYWLSSLLLLRLRAAEREFEYIKKLSCFLGEKKGNRSRGREWENKSFSCTHTHTHKCAAHVYSVVHNNWIGASSFLLLNMQNKRYWGSRMEIDWMPPAFCVHVCLPPANRSSTSFFLFLSLLCLFISPWISYVLTSPILLFVSVIYGDVPNVPKAFLYIFMFKSQCWAIKCEGGKEF